MSEALTRVEIRKLERVHKISLVQKDDQDAQDGDDVKHDSNVFSLAHQAIQVG